MTWTAWSHTKFRLWVEVGIPTGDATVSFQSVTFDVIRLEMNYALNEIPWCQLALALGREVKSRLAANIHWYADYLKMMLPMRVWMFAKEMANNMKPTPFDLWPNGPFCIFEGYTTGTGFDQARSRGASFTLGGIHWLAGLQFSSCLTNRLSAQNASSFITPASNDAGADAPASYVGSTSATRFVTDDNLQQDVWSKILFPWLNSLAQDGPLQLNQVPAIGVNAAAASNAEALAALARFEPALSQPLADQGLLPGPFPFTVPLAFASDLTGAEPFRTGVSTHISNDTVRANSGTTFWDKLANAYAGDFLAMVVPMAQSALFVPKLPALAGRYLTIYPHEYEGIHIDIKSPRPLRGVCVLRGRAQNTGAQGTQQGQEASAAGIGGYYENPSMPAGMILYEQVPAWVGNLTPSTAWGFASANPDGTSGRADAPGVGPGADAMGTLQPQVLAALGRNLWDRYAQAVYVSQAVKDRTGFLNGKMRFDIAPGSTMRIVCMKEKFVAAQTNPLPLSWGSNPFYALYAFVNRVSYLLDAEELRGETRLEFSHVRNDTEVYDPNYSSPLHPLYSTVWPGGPLVNDLNFNGAFFPHPELGGLWEWEWPPDQFGP